MACTAEMIRDSLNQMVWFIASDILSDHTRSSITARLALLIEGWNLKLRMSRNKRELATQLNIMSAINLGTPRIPAPKSLPMRRGKRQIQVSYVNGSPAAVR